MAKTPTNHAKWAYFGKIQPKTAQTLIFTLGSLGTGHQKSTILKFNISRSRALLEPGPGLKESLKQGLLRGKARFSLSIKFVEISKLQGVTSEGRFLTYYIGYTHTDE